MSVDAPTLRRAPVAHGRSRRGRLHYGASALGWVAFVLLWVRAVQLTGSRTLLLIACLLAATAAIVLVVTLLWVRHSVRLSGRLPARRGLPGGAAAPERDFVGRALDLRLEEARAAPVVVVRVDGDVKRFVTHAPAGRR